MFVSRPRARKSTSALASWARTSGCSGQMAGCSAESKSSTNQNAEGTSVYQPYAVQYAGFWWRFLAYAIDALITVCIFFPLGMIIGVVIVATGEDPESSSMLGARLGINLISILVTWLYYAFCESSPWQGTVG